MSVSILESMTALLPERICFEGSAKGISSIVRKMFLGCRTYAGVPGSCIDLLQRVGKAIIELVEKGAASIVEHNYMKALQLSQLLLLSGIAERAEVTTEVTGRKRTFIVNLFRSATVEIPSTNLSLHQLASSIIRSRVLDPTQPLSRIFVSWSRSIDTPIQYEHLEHRYRIVIETVEFAATKNIDTGWLCISIPCTCSELKPVNDGAGRVSRDFVTSIHVLSVTTLALLGLVLSGVAVVTKRGIAPIHRVSKQMSPGLRRFFESLYGAPMDRVARIVGEAVDTLYEEMSKDKVVEVLQVSDVESLRATAYFMSTL